MAASSIAEYEEGTIRRHENTRPDKTADRVKHIRATGAQTVLVFLAYRDSLAIDIIVDAARTASLLYDFTDEQGVRQTVWRIARPVAVEALSTAFTTVPCAYIADGHHRASAAAQVCADMRAEAGPDAGEQGIAFTLFPTTVDQLMAVSDAGMLMPPKSTWFEPKLRSGLFIRRV